MSEFWYTSQTMRAMKGETYRSFELFSPTHLFWLALLAICIVLSLTVYRKMDEKKKRKVYVVMTVLMLADEIFKYVVTLATGQFEWQFLPFHLCSVNLFVCLWHTLHPNRTAKEILYAMSLVHVLVVLHREPKIGHVPRLAEQALGIGFHSQRDGLLVLGIDRQGRQQKEHDQYQHMQFYCYTLTHVPPAADTHCP